MKWISAALCILAFTIRTSSQTPSDYMGHGTPPIPTAQGKPNSLTAVAIDWSYDAQQKMLHLHLVNNSNKDITAYTISISKKFADGSSESNVDGTPEFMNSFETDLWSWLINVQLAKGTVRERLVQQVVIQQDGNPSNGKMFAAGTSRYEHMYETREISGVTTILDVVAYADATANVQNEQAFRQLLVQRKGQVLAMEKVDEAIKHALADPTISSPMSAALAELTPIFADAVTNQSPENPEGNQQLDLQSAIGHLQQMHRWKQMPITERDWLTRYVEDQEKRIALMSPHANLTIQ
jgi:hypothetical protein